MKLTKKDKEILIGMRDHYRDRAMRGSMQSEIPGRNPLFKVQADRDFDRAELLNRIIQSSPKA
jgi:hypothetical protein